MLIAITMLYIKSIMHGLLLILFLLLLISCPISYILYVSFVFGPWVLMAAAIYVAVVTIGGLLCGIDQAQDY